MEIPLEMQAQNKILSQVILMESDLIAFRAYYLRGNSAKEMADTLERFQNNVGIFGEMIIEVSNELSKLVEPRTAAGSLD